MELNQLHYFVAVAHCENITKAAKELFITQPALSRVILRLEQELGTPLFDRHGGRVTLNDHGKAFLRHVEPALESINAGVHAVIDELGGREILIHNYLTADLIKFIVERCQAEFPDISFTVKNIGDNADDDSMLQAKPDIVMLPTQDFHNYVFPMSYKERWCVIYNCKYAFHSEFDGSHLTLRQLTEEPIVLSGSKLDREFVDRIFASAGLTPKILPCTALADSSAQINRCKGIGLVPVSNFRSLIKSIDSIPIAAAMVSDHPCERMLYLGRSPRFLSNADEYQVLEAIKNFLSREYAETDEFFESYFGTETE